MAKPVSYNNEINKVFKSNDLPPINLPKNPPSKDIVSLAKDMKISLFCKIRKKKIR